MFRTCVRNKTNLDSDVVACLVADPEAIQGVKEEVHCVFLNRDLLSHPSITALNDSLIADFFSQPDFKYL